MPSKCYEFKTWGLKTNFEIKKNSSKIRYIERLLEERIQQYILENKHKCFIDADSLVNSLQRLYPEYKTKKRALIKIQARQVIAKLTKELEDPDMDSTNNSVEPIASDSESDRSNLSNISSEDEMSAVNRESLPKMNDTLTKLYKSHSTSYVSQRDDEFINISSDDYMDESTSSSVSTITIEDNDQVRSSDSPPISKKQKICDLSELSPKISASMLEIVGASTPVVPKIVTDQTPSTANGLSEKKIIPTNKAIRKKKTPASSRIRNKNNAANTVPAVNKSAVQDFSNTNIPNVSFGDVAGCNHVLREVVWLIVHIIHPEIYNEVGFDPPRGFLLHGPPGCGKTLLAHAVAGELEVPLLDVAAPELVAGVSGISEQRIRKLFDNAIKLSPCVVFIDEIDCITQNRDLANRDMEKRIVSQLLSSMDKLNRDKKGAQVLVIGATNRPDSLDPALRRAGRFDREVRMGIPDKESRYKILRSMCSKLKLADDVCLREIAALTPGYVGADLLSLIRESALSAVHRAMELVSDLHIEKSFKVHENGDSSMEVQCDTSTKDVLTPSAVDSCDKLLKKSLLWIKDKLPIESSRLKDVSVTMSDFKLSLKRVQPSSKREGFVTIPDVTWDDVGSLEDVRKALKLSILAPVKYLERFNELGLQLSAGVLLCGPPGCGKTLLAKAIANEAGINFISVKGPELLNMYVGGSEKAVRECFLRAKNSEPCVIFFDELDSLCPKRSDNSENSAGMRVVNQLLTEMDGFKDRSGVFLMAATNRPDIIDPAVLRPGRLDKIIYVGFPNEKDRVDILRALTKNGKKPLLHENVNLTEVAKNRICDGFTGADLAALVRDASMLALQEIISSNEAENYSSPVRVTAEHFQRALESLRPSVSEKDRKHYEQLRLKFATSKYELQKQDIQT